MPKAQRPDARARSDGERRSSPGREAFNDALAACRVCLTDLLHGDGDMVARLSGDGIDDAVSVLARSAASQRVPPERVLAAFKQMVTHLPSVARQSADVRGSVVRELTHLIIDAYYRPDGDGNALLRNDGPPF